MKVEMLTAVIMQNGQFFKQYLYYWIIIIGNFHVAHGRYEANLYLFIFYIIPLYKTLLLGAPCGPINPY